MSDKKITELDEVTTPASTDTLPIVSGGATKRVTVANLTAAEAAARAAADTTLQTNIDTKLAKASNLSDLTNAATARTNLGVPAGSGTSTGTNTGDQPVPIKPQEQK